MNKNLEPFKQIARGIPPNWPADCVLRFDEDRGNLILSYYGANDVKNGITIGQWRNLLDAGEEFMKIIEELDDDNDNIFAKCGIVVDNIEK